MTKYDEVAPRQFWECRVARLNPATGEIAFIFMAIQSVVYQLPEPNKRPIWWTNPIRATVQELANAGSDITH